MGDQSKPINFSSAFVIDFEFPFLYADIDARYNPGISGIVGNSDTKIRNIVLQVWFFGNFILLGNR